MASSIKVISEIGTITTTVGYQTLYSLDTNVISAVLKTIVIQRVQDCTGNIYLYNGVSRVQLLPTDDYSFTVINNTVEITDKELGLNYEIQGNCSISGALSFSIGGIEELSSINHALLYGLDYADAGHTGFSPDTHNHTIISLSDVNISSLVNGKFFSVSGGEVVLVDNPGGALAIDDLTDVNIPSLVNGKFLSVSGGEVVLVDEPGGADGDGGELLLYNTISGAM